MKITFFLFICLFLLLQVDFTRAETASDDNIDVVMARLSHGHAHWIFQEEYGADVNLIGIYEPNRRLVQQFRDAYNLDDELFYSDLDRMLEQLDPHGLLAFGSIHEHLSAVEAAAPRGIDVMVEKPLAVSTEHAEKMKSLADEHEIHLLTNYETSWYPSTEKTYSLLHERSENFGQLRKALFYHGHMGPKEIGVGAEFLDWLTDPELNGGGALIDFGCYGANIMTYLAGGERPESVSAVTQTHKPEIYSRVEDDATIILTYSEAQAIIQASWNWPIDRKDMEVYGEAGYIIASVPDKLQIKKAGDSEETIKRLDSTETEIYTDPFAYFADVIRGNQQVAPYSLYSLENNMLVVEILDAAKESARTGRAVTLD